MKCATNVNNIIGYIFNTKITNERRNHVEMSKNETFTKCYMMSVCKVMKTQHETDTSSMFYIIYND